MATKFGVQLKSTSSQGDGSGAKDLPKSGVHGREEKKPVSHLKSMFDQGSVDSSSAPHKGFGLDFSKPSSSNISGGSNVKGKGKLSAKSSLDGGSLSSSLSGTDHEAFKLLSQQLKETGVEGLVDGDTAKKPVVAKAKVFEGGQTYKATIQTKETSSSGAGQPVVTKTSALSQLSSGLALLKIRPGCVGKGDKSLSSLGSSVDEDVPPVTKEFRPPLSKGEGSVTKSDTKMFSRSADVKTGVSSVGTKSNGGPTTLGLTTKDKYISGVPRGWKSTTEESPSKATESQSLSKQSSVSGNSNSKTDVSATVSSVSSTSRFGSTTAPSSNTDLKLSLGTRAGSPFRRQSSGDNSSGSTGTSPRGFRAVKLDKSSAGNQSSPRGNQTGEQPSITDRYMKTVNSSSSTTATKTTTTATTTTAKLTKASDTSITSKYNALASRPNEKSKVEGRSSPVLSAQTDINKNLKNKQHEVGNRIGDVSGTPTDRRKTAQEQLKEDKEKFTRNRLSGSFSSDSDKGVRSSPKVRGQDGKFKWVEKGRISYDEFKQQHRESLKKEVVRSSSTESSSSSLNRSSDQGIRARAERFASPEPQDPSRHNKFFQDINANRQGDGEIKRQMLSSKKISPKDFTEIKKGFEQSPKSGQRKPKLEIKHVKPLLERRQSFENPESFVRQRSVERVVISPREAGKVLETIKSLNDLEAAANAQPTVRRTQSLRKASVDDEEESSGSLYEEVGEGSYYHDVHGVRLADDGQSNEGDLSSEADQIYEIISDVRGREGYSVRRNAMKKSEQQVEYRKKTGDEDSLGRSTSTESKPETGIEADIDSDTDSSRSSGIYEPIDHDIDEGVSQSDSADPEFVNPPPVPKWNNKKKKKGDKTGGQQKGLTAKFKKLYKGRSSEPDIRKTVSSSALPQTGTGAPSNRVFTKIGGKFKGLKKNKTDSNLETVGQSKEEPVDAEACPVCESDSSDLSAELDINPKGMEKSEDEGLAPPPVPHRPPPLPPRVQGAVNRTSSNSLNNTVPDGRVSPKIPPRNSGRISNNLDLNTVIPIAPGGTSASTGDLRKSGWHPSKDSYLQGQQLKSASTSELPYADDSSSTDNVESPPPRPPSSSGRGHMKLQGVDSYVCVDPPSGPDDNYSLADEIQYSRKELDRRPISSAYIKPTDLSTVPAPKSYAPFEDIMKYRAANEEDDMLYMDLSEEQVYGQLAGNRYKSKLETEGLYQFYNKENISRASKRCAIYTCFDESDEEYEDEEERLYEDLSILDKDDKTPDMSTDKTPNKLSTLEMFGKKGTVLRMLWAETPEVKTSGVLDTITPLERKIQEAMFEIISSEATYLKSLNVLINVFLTSQEFSSDLSDRCVLTQQERHNIFSNIGTIRDASEKFLSDLESRWQKSVLLSNVCDLITKNATENFECYVRYCSNQTFQDRMVTQLRKKQDFFDALKRLESHPDCQGLPMISFLLLPMQRITRLPLLVDAICHRIDPVSDKERHKFALKAQQALNKVVKRCNEGAKKMQQTEQMCLIAQQLEFKIKEIPLISASRFLVKQGELTRVMGESKALFGKGKAGKQSLYLFLFSDIVLITKKRGNQYVVMDYAMRNAVHVEAIDNVEKMSRLLPNGVPSGWKHLFLLVMLENFDKKEMEMVFSCQSASDRARWLDAVTPVKVSEDQERIYEEWDCPQVQCTKTYKPIEPDELALEESDVINVFKKLEDGWYEGERMRDGERGWFPAEHTEEILNSHVRARNLRLRYRMMRGTDDQR